MDENVSLSDFLSLCLETFELPSSTSAVPTPIESRAQLAPSTDLARIADADLPTPRTYRGREYPPLAPMSDVLELAAADVEDFLARLDRARDLGDQACEIVRLLIKFRDGGRFDMYEVSGVSNGEPVGSTWMRVGSLAFRWRVRLARRPPAALREALDLLLSDQRYIDAAVTYLRRMPAGIAPAGFAWEELGWDKLIAPAAHACKSCGVRDWWFTSANVARCRRCDPPERVAPECLELTGT